MYNNIKFWIFATICFAISSIMYILSYGILNFVSILNIIFFLVSFISSIVFIRKNKSVSILDSKKQKSKIKKKNK